MKKKKKSLFDFEGGLSMIQKVIATIITLSAFLGLAFSLEAHWTPKTEFVGYKAEDMKKTEDIHMELAQFKQQYVVDTMDRNIEKIQEHIWKLEDRIAELKKSRGSSKGEIDTLESELRDLKFKLEQAKKSREDQYKAIIQQQK